MQFSDFGIIKGRLFSTVLFYVILIARNEVASYSRGRTFLHVTSQCYYSRFLRNHQLFTSKSRAEIEGYVQQPEITDLVASPTSKSLKRHEFVLPTEKIDEIEPKTMIPKIKLTTSQKLERDITALKTFFSIHGHFRVPYYYIIPDGGKADNCTNSRIRRKSTVAPDASTMTVTSSDPSTGSKPKKRKSASSTKSSDRTSGAIYPAEVYGLKLGRRVAQIRRREIYVDAEHREQLQAIGMMTCSQSQVEVLENEAEESRSRHSVEHKRGGSTDKHYLDNPADRDGTLTNSKSVMNDLMTSKEHTREIKFLQILSALKVHDDLFGDMLVPRYFTVPSEEPWPEPAWGMQLGNRVRNIRAKSAYNQPRFHKILEESGFLMSLEHVKMPLSR